MRAALLTRSLEIGGTERQVVELANGLAARGHDLALWSVKGAGQLSGDLASRVHFEPLGKRSRFDLVSAPRNLLRAARSIRPDVIYSFLTSQNVSLGILKGLLPRCKIVWGVRASDQELARSSPIEHLALKLSVMLSKRADLIICNSNSGAGYYRDLGYPAAKLKVIYNGFNPERFCFDAQGRERTRSKLGLTPQDKVVGVVARLDAMKDHGTFLKACRIHLQSRPDTKFVIAYPTKSSALEKLQAAAFALGISNSLSWLEAGSSPSDVYSALDLLCSPSAYGEGFSNVLAEAMLCGLPCVATDVGDARIILSDLGKVIPPREPQLLADAISAALASPNLGDAGHRTALRGRILSDFSLNNMILLTEQALSALA